MIRTLFSTVIAGLLAAPALADVTVTAQVAGKGGESQSITYIKGLKMRSDSSVLGTPTTTITDIEAQKFISINHKKKEVTVYDMAQFRQDLDKNMKTGPIEASLKPNGQTKDFAGRACTGYDMAMALPMVMGQGGPEMSMMMAGPVFIAKGAPGSADYARFHNAAAEKGFIMSDPRAAKANPSQTKGLTQLYKAMGDTGGIPYYMEINVKIEGGGPMAGMMNKMMGGAAFTQTVTAVSTDPVPDDKFTPPADYKVKESK